MDRRAVRHAETRADIVAASWEAVREHGLSGLSMRDLGERVGMRAQSIYSYFSSKHDIYDAMFREGNLAFAATLSELMPAGVEDDPVDVARRAAHAFVGFCTADPIRYQLLFQRPIPDFEPSPESFAVALEVYEIMRRHLSSVGVADDAARDLWTAVLTGLTSQQISNDPGGDRWVCLVDRAVDMLLAETRSHPESETP